MKLKKNSKLDNHRLLLMVKDFFWFVIISFSLVFGAEKQYMKFKK